MSALETILSRAMSDTVFADLLFASPDKAIAGYDLSAEEITKITTMFRADFTALALEDRKSFVSCGLIQKFEGGDIEGEVTNLPIAHDYYIK
jgi:hypothetical protein